MNKISSDTQPEIVRLQGDIIVPFQAEQMEMDGKTSWRYLEHRETDNGQDCPDVAAIRSIVYGRAEADLHAHIFSRYPIPSQTSISAYAVHAMRLEREDILSACESVQTWCSQCVAYFRGIIAATHSQDPMTVSWDFPAACPVPSGLPSLSDIEAMFAG